MRMFAVTLAVALAFAPVAFADDATKPSAENGVPQRPSLVSERITSKDWFVTLKASPAVVVSVVQQTDHGPISASFKGALLWDVVDHASWANGQGKNAYLRYAIIVTGKDGYAAAISEREIDPRLEGKQVIVAYEKDGKPLDAPRLVVPDDAHASRGVHDVVGIEVK